MSKRPKDDKVFLGHMLQEIDAAEHTAARRDSDPEIVKRAVVRCLEIIGEATVNISKPLKEKHPEVPWREMKDMRDMLIHEYFGVSMDLIWGVVENELPALRKQIQHILKELESPDAH